MDKLMEYVTTRKVNASDVPAWRISYIEGSSVYGTRYVDLPTPTEAVEHLFDRLFESGDL